MGLNITVIRILQLNSLGLIYRSEYESNMLK